MSELSHQYRHSELLQYTYMATKKKKKSNNPNGRNPIPIDEKLLESLSRLHLSVATMAKILGCHEDTLHRRFAAKIAEWQSKTDAKLADVLYDEAVNRRQAYAIKMMTQRRLGYADKYEHTGNLTLEDLVAGANKEEDEKK